jgi:hypothetical protein
VLRLDDNGWLIGGGRRQPRSVTLRADEFRRATCAARAEGPVRGGRWPVSSAPAAGSADCYERAQRRRGATDQIRAPRNRDPREAEAGPLVASCLDYLALQPPSGVNDAPVAMNVTCHGRAERPGLAASIITTWEPTPARIGGSGTQDAGLCVTERDGRGGSFVRSGGAGLTGHAMPSLRLGGTAVSSPMPPARKAGSPSPPVRRPIRA